MNRIRTATVSSRTGRVGVMNSEKTFKAFHLKEQLATNGQTLAVAESCTGGLFSHCITDVPGSSGFFRGGVIAYSDEIKQALLDVDEDVLSDCGAVSSEVAVQMADGVREKFGADYGVGITGIAGPAGGSDQKPVGTVFIAASSADASKVEQLQFSGERDEIKELSVSAAFEILETIVKR